MIASDPRYVGAFWSRKRTVKNWKQKGVLDHICWVLLEAIRNVMQRLE
jgi:hypothetical protein